MASSLEDELSCPICCELYRDPQLLSCGHTFCCRCLHKHWGARSAHTCPMCRQECSQKPVSNLVVRNTCETYLREKEKKERESDECPKHRERIVLFCKTDGKAVCSECRKQGHSSHRIQPLTQAIQQRKGQLKEVLRPAEKALESLRNGTSQNSQVSKYIQSQAQRAEKLIKVEFEKMHQFLRLEEETRVAALKKEEEMKRGKLEAMAKREIRYLSDKVRDVEEHMEKEGTAFLQNYDIMLQRAQYTVPDSDLGPENLINMAEHAGNLGYKVWEKMMDFVHYYPVILDPNSAPADFSIADDLVCVRKSAHDRPSPVPQRGHHLVLGSDGYIDGVHCWDVEVRDSKHWTLGVCRRSAAKGLVRPLTPETGFWGLSRKGDSYRLLTPRARTFQLSRKPRTVRVKLGWRYSLDKNIWKGWRVLSFQDPSDDSLIAYFSGLPSEEELFPFLIPEERFAPLHIAPAKIVLTTVVTFPREEKQTEIHAFLVCLALMAWLIYSYISG